MYILRAIDVIGTVRFYTGKAGEGWLSENPADSFGYETLAGATRKAILFNRQYGSNDWRFIPLGFLNGEVWPVSIYECLTADDAR